MREKQSNWKIGKGYEYESQSYKWIINIQDDSTSGNEGNVTNNGDIYCIETFLEKLSFSLQCDFS